MFDVFAADPDRNERVSGILTDTLDICISAFCALFDIIDAADKLFCRNGYAETTVEDILAVLGCSKGSFYHYFDSKLAVLQAICEDKAVRSFAIYQQTRVANTREKLNALLYYAQPFRPEEEEWLELILRLRRRGEALMIDGALRQR